MKSYQFYVSRTPSSTMTHFRMVTESTPMDQDDRGDPVIETSDATSSSEVIQKQTSTEMVKIEEENVAPEQQIDIEGCRQQLLQQQLLLQQIQLQHLQNTSIDEQVLNSAKLNFTFSFPLMVTAQCICISYSN